MGSATVASASASDAQLMAEASAGSVDAFGSLYDRYCDRAYRVAFAICRDDGCAQDAVQEAFVSIWTTSSGYHAERGPVAAWLLSVVRHRAIDLVRGSNTARPRKGSDADLDDGASSDATYEQVVAGEQDDAFLDLLGQLPDAQREVITLAYCGQLSHTEIAAQLGLPTGTVKGRMRLGMHKLRAQSKSGDG
jgi:RNA polymerase sigma factor (sigma-70 family)